MTNTPPNPTPDPPKPCPPHTPFAESRQPSIGKWEHRHVCQKCGFSTPWK